MHDLRYREMSYSRDEKGQLVLAEFEMEHRDGVLVFRLHIGGKTAELRSTGCTQTDVQAVLDARRELLTG